MRLSTRNQLPATVESIVLGEAMAAVKVTIDCGHPMTASITKEAVEDLSLVPGSRVTVLVKSTQVMLAVE
jgi:molybdate transport system regulatory protein